MPRLYVGVDVSKERLDVCFRSVEDDQATLEHKSYGNTAEGHQELVSDLTGRQVALVVTEASGGYQEQMALSVFGAGVKIAVVNPRQVRDFARSTGRLAKTDKLDAEILALFAERIRPEPTELHESAQRELKAIYTRRSQIVEMITVEKNRLQQAQSFRVRESISAHLEYLQTSLGGVEQELEQFVKENSHWRKLVRLMRSVPGVGPVLCYAILAELPEIGKLTRKKISALVGLAPFNWESGTYRGERRIKGGRGAIRAKLYMGVLAAVRYDNPFGRYYHELVSRGKKHKVALVATMRKLLSVVNAMVHQNTRFEPALCSARK